jgi:hypothetical protein
VPASAPLCWEGTSLAKRSTAAAASVAAKLHLKVEQVGLGQGSVAKRATTARAIRVICCGRLRVHPSQLSTVAGSEELSIGESWLSSWRNCSIWLVPRVEISIPTIGRLSDDRVSMCLYGPMDYRWTPQDLPRRSWAAIS